MQRILYFGMENYLWVLFSLCYLYQFVYTVYKLIDDRREVSPPDAEEVLHTYGIVIAARNEEDVLGALIDSIHGQDYPAELLHVYVVADNCSDNTAEIAREKGAEVFVRNDLSEIGKGYALHFIFDRLLPRKDCDGYIIFDADNLVAPDYVKEINRTFCRGYQAILGYRNSKNYASNWISAGYSLWFLRDSEFLNWPRMRMNTSCLVAGTGFLVSRKVLEDVGGWNYFSLTEDVEFSAEMIIRGERIGYCGKAMFFDEQPVTFRQSWVQRVRWARGFYQVVWRRGKDLVHGVVERRSFACFDMLMSIFPALLITLLYIVIAFARVLIRFIQSPTWETVVNSLVNLLPVVALGYLFMFLVGLVPTITEWKHIDAASWQKIKYVFTFPVFMATFIPVAGAAFFKKVEWEPVKHTVTKRVEDLIQTKRK